MRESRNVNLKIVTSFFENKGNEEKKIQRKQKGITLIALVIIIIVLLILAGVTIATLTGENGILTRASEARDRTGQANAEEQVQIAVVGSIGKDGNINNGDLKNNLNKIENISGVPEEITDESYPFTVTVDGYKVSIKKNGTVKEPGKWAETTNEDGETVITDGTIELKIGDYINYDPTNGGKIEDTEEENGIKYSYKSLQGTFHADYTQVIDDTSANMERGNGYQDQYFSIEAETNGWRVLGLNEETDEIMITPVNTIKAMGKEGLYLMGQTGAEWGVRELNDICAIYGKGKGASGARSITVEDINDITGYNPEETRYNAGEIDEYGNEVTYIKTSSGIQYKDTTHNMNEIFEDEETIFRYYDKESNEWKTLSNGQSQKIKSTNYAYYPNTLTQEENEENLETVGIRKDSKEYEILFSTASSNQDYWLASSCVGTYRGSICIGLRCVNFREKVEFDDSLFYSDGTVMDSYYGVRPIVFLNADVSISGGDGTTIGTAYQIQ